MSIAVLIEAAEFLERRERGEERLFICISSVIPLGMENPLEKLLANPVKCRSWKKRKSKTNMALFVSVHKASSTHQLFCKSVGKPPKRIAQFFIPIRFN
jgi:hypothetical protein